MIWKNFKKSLCKNLKISKTKNIKSTDRLQSTNKMVTVSAKEQFL